MTMTEYASVLQKSLDKQIVQESCTGWMEANAKNVKYNGGRTIKIGKISFAGGLSDYDRDNGYTKGSAHFGYETFEMKMDRNKKLRVDRMDVDESGFIISASEMAAEFQRTVVIPEMDAYRIMTVAKAASISETYTVSASTLYSKLLDDIAKLRDVGVTDMVIMLSHLIGGIMDKTEKISQNISLTEFSSGKLNTVVKSIDNIPILRAPSARMKSDFVFYPGKDEDDYGGYAPADGAKSINWIIAPRNAPIAISKTDNIKIITPEENQLADAWDVPYRKYHDCFVPENKRAGILVSYAG